MKINIRNTDTKKGLLQRLFDTRGIDCETYDFLNPTFKKYRIPPHQLDDMDKAVQIIFSHIKKNSKIMIFWDYDVDGVTSSYCLFSFFTKFLQYKNCSIKYPNRLTDGYGLKNKHVKEMKDAGIDLIITVDNGITSIQEATYAKELNIDLVITDHHHALDTLPQANAVVNPQISSAYEFKGIAGVGVAFKVINALMEAAEFSAEKKKECFEYFLPIVTIGTVADCVPLVKENRVMVKKGLALINQKRHAIPASLQGFLDHVNIKGNMDTFHIGFVIWPRINAGGRLWSPYDSLRTLLFSGEKQKEYLTQIDAINTERKKLQDKALKHALTAIDVEQKILIATDHSYHEGIVGIVSGRITEKYTKPSMVLHMCEERGIAVGSLRCPQYFSVIEMLKTADHLLERYGGHQFAGWLTVKLENLEELKQHFYQYAHNTISDDQLIKVVNVDTHLLAHERESNILQQIQQLAPFGVGNEEPLFIIPSCTVLGINKVGQRGKGHLKMTVDFHGKTISALRWSKGDLIGDYEPGNTVNLIGKIKSDSFSGGFMVECKTIEKLDT